MRKRQVLFVILRGGVYDRGVNRKRCEMKETAVQAGSAALQDERSIVTDRLVLRPFEEGDYDILHRLYGDAEIMLYTPFDPESPQQSEAHLARAVADWCETPLLSREYVIALWCGGDDADAGLGAADEQKIGRCHILLDDAQEAPSQNKEVVGGRAMIGWMLVQEAWGRGYATETAAALIAYCFDVLGLEEVYGLCHPDNAASKRVMEKCGMTLHEWRKDYVEYKKNGRCFLQDELEYTLRQYPEL